MLPKLFLQELNVVDAGINDVKLEGSPKDTFNKNKLLKKETDIKEENGKSNGKHYFLPLYSSGP